LTHTPLHPVWPIGQQTPLDEVSPFGQTHSELWQVAPLGQTAPQPPQLFGSLVRSAHVLGPASPVQSIVPEAH
jgi:hypothetical protein